MTNLMKYRRIYYGISLSFLLISVISLVVWGLKPSIDFTGGTKLELEGTKDKEAISRLASESGFQNVIITVNDRGISLRAKEINTDSHNKFKAEVEKLTGVKETSLETVGPTISREITTRAFTSITLASLLIVFYIGYSFRKVPKPTTSWEFGIIAIVTLLHDAFIVIGLFAILGRFMGVEVDPLFITAILTVIGFSVHDTIVIFDRIRENLIKSSGTSLEKTVNLSVVEMLPRTISTSFLVWAMLLILFLFGGVTIKYFVLALLVGIFVGSYSSILIASPLLISWQNIKQKRRLRKVSS